jgi:hypothetical protein
MKRLSSRNLPSRCSHWATRFMGPPTIVRGTLPFSNQVVMQSSYSSRHTQECPIIGRSLILGSSTEMTALLPSRIKFAFTVTFHIVFPSLTIGLAMWLSTLEAFRLATGRSVSA